MKAQGYLNNALNAGTPKKTLPRLLNILTIFTFIGCGILSLLLLVMPVFFSLFPTIIDKLVIGDQHLSAEQMDNIKKEELYVSIAQNTIVPEMFVGIIGVVLCFTGALWMRKLKKEGFWLYTVGELLPILVGFTLLTTLHINGMFSVIYCIIVPLLFVLLYSTQRKYLTR
ncbi:MAG: hypothetical protein QM791_10780 [Ferruginibacter sp.]